jgi:DNA mismatch repair protein MutS
MSTTEAIETQTAANTDTSDSPFQSDFFAAPNHPAVELLDDINPDELTPRQAQELLYRLKSLSSK